MAHVFWQNSADATWASMPLQADSYSMAVCGQQLVLTAQPATAPWPALVRAAAAGRRQWLCVATADERVPLVNGDPLVGFRILAHRDMVEIGQAEGHGASRGVRLIFSAEVAARVEAFEIPDGSSVRCPRCLQELTPGDPVVRCPGCGTVHHARPDLPCWTYGPKCAVCRQATAMSSELAWTPDTL